MNSHSVHYIAHLSTPKNWRGGEQQIAYLATELSENKMIRQTVLTPANSSLSNFIENYNKENATTNLEVESLKGSSKFGQARFLASFCKKNKITIVHLHDAHAHTIGVLSAVFFQNKTKFILSRRVDFPVKNNFFSKYKYNHSSIKKIVCVSDKIKEITAPSIKDKSKLVTVHSGIDLEKFNNLNDKKAKTTILRQEYNLEKDTILIGNVAALAPHKDYITFLETAKILIPKLEQREKKENTNREIRFFLIGKEDGSETEIQNWLNQNQEIKNYFILTGFRNDIPIILKELDVFLDKLDKLDLLDKLEVWHLNDSRDEFNSGHDRHDNIGEGKMNIDEFKILLNHKKMKNYPFIIETPGFDGNGPDQKNLDILKSLITS